MISRSNGFRTWCVLATACVGRLARRGAAARLATQHRQQEQRQDHADVRDPGDRLEHRGLRREVEDPLQQRAVPGVRWDRRAHVEREGVEAGQERRLLEVVDAVREDAGRDEHEQRAGHREEPRQVDPNRTAVDQEPEQHRDRDPGAEADQWLSRAAAGRLGRGVEDDRGLETLATDPEERDHRDRERPDRQRVGQAAPQVSGDRPGRPSHPEDHPRDERDRDDRVIPPTSSCVRKLRPLVP